MESLSLLVFIVQRAPNAGDSAAFSGSFFGLGSTLLPNLIHTLLLRRYIDR